MDTGKTSLNIEGLFHPFIENPVTNNFYINEKNVCFLTGSNMTGKSTLLKSIGLSVYLAHIGFPVPASKFETTVFDGLITTINLADNVNLGYSHFFTEVKRVKETAVKLKGKKRYFILFDELFRGTNVRDAYESSLLIIRGFSKIKNSDFIISTHLIELAKELDDCKNISFKYMENTLDNSEPKFHYKLKDGVSTDRLGILIVKNEGILDILDDLE